MYLYKIKNISRWNLDNDIKAVCLSSDSMLFGGNISVVEGEFVELFAEKYECPNLGDRGTTVNLMTVMHSSLIQKLKEIPFQYCADYAITIDCLPYSLSDEALIIQVLGCL